jgi:hypothetical protein
MKEYRLRSCTLRADTPSLVGATKGHFWFPTLHPVGGDDILCLVVLSDDKAQGKWPAALHLSRDRGKTWRKVPNEVFYGPISRIAGPRQVLLMPYELWPVKPGDKRNAQADGTVLLCGSDGKISLETVTVQYLDFPRDLADYHVGELCLLTNGNILPLSAGRQFATVYGQYAGQKRYTNFAVASEDGGRTWRYCSVVAGCDDLPDAGEGPNESATVRLADGRLLCVYRTGHVLKVRDYFKSYSADGGRSWTKPERMVGVWSVEPQLVRLENGLILLSGGRPGLFLWVCADGEGKSWERLNLAEHHNALLPDSALHYSGPFCASEGVNPAQSTSYTGMQRVGPNEALVSYDRLGNGWAGAPGPWGETDAVFSVRVEAVRG